MTTLTTDRDLTADASCVVAMTTLPLDADAGAIARALVEARVAACVQVCPQLSSTYRWQGAIHQDEERLVLMKTTRARVADLWETLRALHPYDVPEFVVVSIEAGHGSYLQWVAQSTIAETLL